MLRSVITQFSAAAEAKQIQLTIARLLVELHQGTIEVASEGKGRGATFIVKLPLN